MSDLAGRNALVTGAGRRVGAAIARHLGAQGVNVAVHYHGSETGALETCSAIERSGSRAVPLRADLTTREPCRLLIDRAERLLGGLDLLVASAASYERVAFEAIDDASWNRSLELNLNAPFALAHRARGALRRTRGSIVFLTDMAVRAPYPDYVPYLVSKGALVQLMRVLALELAPEVRVNAVAPGTVLPPVDMDADELGRITQAIPLGRAGRPEDVADAVLYLVRASYVTGQELVIDGGRLLGHSGHRTKPA
ncbi:MAG: SDR family oxidoreductase [Proteobacteria bacterium]|nr:SDR family oxidoreductase [Pseudomonadota bacterium]